jgi:hypothetical protein
MGRASGFKATTPEDDDLPWYVFGDARRAALAAKKDKTTGRALPAVERAMPGSEFLPKKREQSRMGSDKNVDVGRGRGTVPMKPSEPAPKDMTKRATTPSVARKPAGEYVAPSSVESALTAGIQGLPGGQSGVSQEAGSDYGRTTYFGETPEAATQVAQQMRKGLFGEEISQEDYDAMTQRNKDASFFGRFKKGGQVKKTKKMAKGGSVSPASKRGDGCCQRGKTKGRMV